MTDFRIGYLYSFAPIHCGGEGDLGNILDIVREVHTEFPYVPGSSWRGALREEVRQYGDEAVTDRLFGKELSDGGQMGVHQVWFGDARLLWVPMRTLAMGTRDVFMWVSCHSLIRDHALLSHKQTTDFPDHAVGDRAGTYTIADATITVSALTEPQKQAIDLAAWCPDLGDVTQRTWQQSRIVLPDAVFQILMEHALWTQIRNVIDDVQGSAKVFWTDICIPRDTFLYYAWGYNLSRQNPVTQTDCDFMHEILTGLLQIGGQANVGRGWVQSWIANRSIPAPKNAVLKAAVEARS